MKRKGLIQYNKRKTISPSRPILWLRLCCLAAIFLIPDFAFAENKTHNPDPTDILESYLNTSKNDNKQPKDATNAPKPIAIKIQMDSASPVNFAAKDSSASNNLASARITLPADEKDKENRSELRDLINRLNSVEITASTVEINTKKTQIEAPSKKVIDSESSVSKSLQDNLNETSKAESDKPFAVDNNGFTENDLDAIRQQDNLKDETIKQIKDLIDSPEPFNQFFELGEIMFDSNRLSEAYIFYKRSLDSTDDNDVEKRTWILFQMANCLRNTDYSKAIEHYKTLIAECPHCQWSEFAKDQIKLLSWYLADDPQGLIRKSKIQVE